MRIAFPDHAGQAEFRNASASKQLALQCERRTQMFSMISPEVVTGAVDVAKLPQVVAEGDLRIFRYVEGCLRSGVGSVVDENTITICIVPVSISVKLKIAPG